MKLEIIGTPIDKIFDILKTNEKVNTLKCYSGKININLTDDVSRETLHTIKNSIINKLSGAVKNYIMKVVN
ncbi:MAG TPA: hypothetical protein PK467_05350 [Candidatus Wallbacteria bacterium]|nr:MAG: hypothetical protein BWY32_03138 [bacterium ADurb.Bin243]HOD39514.1 hypothetical protein [Candidatus Wallbacteria bacterium]HOT75191.1 hypothetical protein [Candidatus Wallbacteria bacterium]HPG58729.1 hypothetical protein [Candidatus Wallbacteria bacterium]